MILKKFSLLVSFGILHLGDFDLGQKSPTKTFVKFEKYVIIMFQLKFKLSQIILP
jgi:hypothetical protein